MFASVRHAIADFVKKRRTMFTNARIVVCNSGERSKPHCAFTNSATAAMRFTQNVLDVQMRFVSIAMPSCVWFPYMRFMLPLIDSMAADIMLS